MQYYIYNNTTGIIKSVGITNIALESIQVETGFTAVEGSADKLTQKVDTINGGLISYTPPSENIDYNNRNRIARDKFLASCDWTQLSDNSLTTSKKAEWATYRQSLRDLPSTVSTFSTAYLSDSDLPTKPS